MTFGMRVMPPTRTTSSISALRDAGVLERLLARLEQRSIRSSTRLSNLARVSFSEVLRPGGVGGDEGQVDLGLLDGGGQLDLGLLGGLLEALEGHACPSSGRCRSPS
jgi:hypothetical protein